jgi:signal transduction histidine kinase
MTSLAARPLLQSRRSPTAGWAVAALVVGAVTLLLYPLQGLDPGVSSGVLYVLGVLLVSVQWGLRLGLVTSIVSAAALYYFHTDPIGSLQGKSPDDMVAVVTLLVTSCVASIIADRARLRAEEAEGRVRLEEELRRRDAERIRMEELRVSRARVMNAADEERRRVVRDLHDGAQQRLVHTVIALKLARRELESRRPDASSLLEEALQHAEHAMVELRELAHGILPSVLTRGGLRAGAEALASRMPLPVRVRVHNGRLPAAVEATAYFVVAEALTNVAKHARAASAEVTARIDDGALRVEVRDDGVGGARPDGSGLVGLGDRLAVLNGRLRVENPADGGTLVAAAIPIPG